MCARSPNRVRASLTHVRPRPIKSEELADALAFAASKRVPAVVIGRGSNVLFADAGFDGVVIVNAIDTIERVFDRNRSGGEKSGDDDANESESESNESSLWKVGAGYAFNHLGAALSKEGWSGLEFAVGIPGTVGGAVFMNAGADGGDTATALVEVECVSPDGGRRRIATFDDDDGGGGGGGGGERAATASSGAFGYRTSPFQSRAHPGNPNRGREEDLDAEADAEEEEEEEEESELAGWIVASATFRLRRDPRANDRAKAFLRRRARAQPLSERSVGCVFRNPPITAVNPDGLSAGALIDRAGLKGTRCGGAVVSEAHANFLLYKEDADADVDADVDADARGGGSGGGGADEMEALIRKVKAAVLEKTGVALREEVWRVPRSFSSVSFPDDDGGGGASSSSSSAPPSPR